MDQIAKHNQTLVSAFIEGLDEKKYDLLSHREGDARSTLIFISHRNKDRNAVIYQSLRDRGIYCAFRAGKLRFSPHLYNTLDDIDQALALLNSL